MNDMQSSCSRAGEFYLKRMVYVQEKVMDQMLEKV